jgi:Photoprotection regulator fluorescence recovery protein
MAGGQYESDVLVTDRLMLAAWTRHKRPRSWLAGARWIGLDIVRYLIVMASMDQLRWSDAEKKIARRVFEKALQQELDEIIHKVKEMARNIKGPTDLWKMEDYLTRRRKDIDSTYDYRYSQLPLLFGQLVQKGQISLEDLHGLGEEKLAYVRFMTSSGK